MPASRHKCPSCCRHVATLAAVVSFSLAPYAYADDPPPEATEPTVFKHPDPTLRMDWGTGEPPQLLGACHRDSLLSVSAESFRPLCPRCRYLSGAVDEPAHQPASLLGHRQRQILHQPIPASLSRLDLSGPGALGRAGFLAGVRLHICRECIVGGDRRKHRALDQRSDRDGHRRQFPGRAAVSAGEPAAGGSDGGGPSWWRELGATLLSPPTGFNRLVYGNRFAPVFAASIRPCPCASTSAAI